MTTPPSQQARPARRWPAALATYTAGIATGAVAMFVITDIRDGIDETGATSLRSAAQACKATEAVNNGDDGQSLEVSGNPGASLVAAYCVLDELNAPDSVVSRMESTRALDGTRDARWHGLYATWNYHPDDGLSLVISTGTER